MKKIMCSVFLISICSFLLKAAAPPRPIAPKPIAGTSGQRQGFLSKITSPVIKFLENRAIKKQQAAERKNLVRLTPSTVPMTPNPLYGGRQVTSMPSGQAASRPSVSIEPYKASPQQLANRPLPQTPPPLNTVKVPGTPAGVYDTFAAGKAPEGKPVSVSVSTQNSEYVTLSSVRSQQPASSNVNYATLSFKEGSQPKPKVTVPTTQYATIQQTPKVPVYQNSAAIAENRRAVGAQPVYQNINSSTAAAFAAGSSLVVPPIYSFPKKTKQNSNV